MITENKEELEEIIKEIFSSDEVKKKYLIKLSDDLYKLGSSEGYIDFEFTHELMCCKAALDFIVKIIGTPDYTKFISE